MELGFVIAVHFIIRFLRLFIGPFFMFLTRVKTAYYRRTTRAVETFFISAEVIDTSIPELVNGNRAASRK
jgi:hypothetical protein